MISVTLWKLLTMLPRQAKPVKLSNGWSYPSGRFDVFTATCTQHFRNVSAMSLFPVRRQYDSEQFHKNTLSDAFLLYYYNNMCEIRVLTCHLHI